MARRRKLNYSKRQRDYDISLDDDGSMSYYLREYWSSPLDCDLKRFRDWEEVKDEGEA